MAFGRMPYAPGLDEIIRRRVALMGPQGPTPTLMRRQPLEPAGFGPPAEQIPVEGPPARPGFFGELGSQPGREALAAGIEAGLGQHDPLQAAIRGFGAAFATKGRAKAAAAKETKAAEQEAKKLNLEERKVAADELRASREPTSQTMAQELQDQYDFLKSIGATDQQIAEHFLLKGIGGKGRGGGGQGAFADRLAFSLVATGQAKNIDEARVMAARFGKNAQVVGQVERFVQDPENIDNFIRTRLNVLRSFDPKTGKWITVDESGNPVSEQDLRTIRTNPGSFLGGTGGTTPPAPAPPLGMVPSHGGTRPSAAAFDTR